MVCVRETPLIMKRRQHVTCKRQSPQKNKASMGCVRETPLVIPPNEKQTNHVMCKRRLPQKNKAGLGYVSETRQIKMKPARDV